jgi:glycosyltransferase involved in cell wall biosynthesis
MMNLKITYTSPNASHHYHYANELDNLNSLYALVSGWPRFAPKSRHLRLKTKLIREDFFQSMALLLGKCSSARDVCFSLSNSALDARSFRLAVQSDVFLFYRSTGVNTTKRLKYAGHQTICIMEEVNSHVLYAHQLILQEYLKLGFSPCDFPYTYDLRKRLDAYQISDYILCPSSFVRRSLTKYGIPEEKIIVNTFGMAPVSFAGTMDPVDRDNVFRILYVGQVNVRKGLRYLVEAFKLLIHPRKELVIVGPMTSCTGLEKTILPEGLSFKGVLKGRDLSQQYSAASVFVLPSVEEGMALVIGEALASGLPVIATTNTGAEDIMTSGIEGFIVEPCNSLALADALQTIIDTPSLRDQMSTNSLKTATTISCWQVSASNLVAKLSSLESGSASHTFP